MKSSRSAYSSEIDQQVTSVVRIRLLVHQVLFLHLHMYLSGRRQLLEYQLQVQWSIDQIAQSSKRNSWLALPNSESNPHDYCVSCRNGSKTTAGGIIRNLLHYWLARSCAQLLAHGIIDDISGAKFYSIAGGVAMAALWQAWVRFALQCFHCQCVRSGEPGPRQPLIQGDREIIKGSN